MNVFKWDLYHRTLKLVSNRPTHIETGGLKENLSTSIHRHPRTQQMKTVCKGNAGNNL